MAVPSDSKLAKKCIAASGGRVMSLIISLSFLIWQEWLSLLWVRPEMNQLELCQKSVHVLFEQYLKGLECRVQSYFRKFVSFLQLCVMLYLPDPTCSIPFLLGLLAVCCLAVI
jgi:predicted CDP-diglyceride synthetase/phosphatidate cytidylyltransferase